MKVVFQYRLQLLHPRLHRHLRQRPLHHLPPVPTETPMPTSTPGVEPTSPPPWWAPAENILMKDEPDQEREAFFRTLKPDSRPDFEVVTQRRCLY